MLKVCDTFHVKLPLDRNKAQHPNIYAQKHIFEIPKMLILRNNSWNCILKKVLPVQLIKPAVGLHIAVLSRAQKKCL